MVASLFLVCNMMPNRKLYLAEVTDGNIKIIKFKDNQMNDYDLLKSLDNHHGGKVIRCLQYDPQSKTLFSGGEDGNIKIIKFKDNQMNDYDLLKSLDKHHGGYSLFLVCNMIRIENFI
jgi:WD40 repeat protein